MVFKDIIKVTNAKALYDNPLEDLNMEFKMAFTSDLMSDVLCYLRNVDDNVLLITGLTNLQVIHAANTLDIKAILITRDKHVEPHVINAAKENSISLYVTKDTLFEASGKIYNLR